MYAWVEKYVGIPFVSGGRDKTGLDCYGLVRLVLRDEYGYNLPVFNGDYTNADNVLVFNWDSVGKTGTAAKIGSTDLLSGVDYTNALNVAETKRLFCENVPLLCGKKIEAPEEKAVALIRMCGRLCHVGLYAGDGFIIHARHRTGVVCERISSPQLAGRVEGWYRVDSGYSMSQSVQRGTDGIHV